MTTLSIQMIKCRIELQVIHHKAHETIINENKSQE